MLLHMRWSYPRYYNLHMQEGYFSNRNLSYSLLLPKLVFVLHLDVTLSQYLVKLIMRLT